MPKYRGYSKHHIVPSSMGWSNSQNNLKQLKNRTHEKLHILFSNRTPKEQQGMMYAINNKALSKQVQWALEYILSLEEQYWYKDGVRLPKDKEIVYPDDINND